MSKMIMLAAAGAMAVGTAGIAAPELAMAAPSSFQGTCSNIGFTYSNNQPTLNAVCLRGNGTANPTSIVLQGISNQNGNLVQGGGASSFQASCGNITISVTPASATLNAYCRGGNGQNNVSSLALNGIGNSNGVLTQ